MVVELFLRWLPMQKIKVLAVVLKMAAHTVLAIRILHLKLGVVPMVRRQALGHFLMTIETLKGRSAGAKLMAARALRGSR